MLERELKNEGAKKHEKGNDLEAIFIFKSSKTNITRNQLLNTSIHKI